MVVLKGARTIVCDGTIDDDYCSINPTGGPVPGAACTPAPGPTGGTGGGGKDEPGLPVTGPGVTPIAGVFLLIVLLGLVVLVPARRRS